MREVWRDGTFAEYAKVLLKNCISLEEENLRNDLCYSIQELMYICHLIVRIGGLRDINVEPAELSSSPPRPVGMEVQTSRLPSPWEQELLPLAVTNKSWPE